MLIFEIFRWDLVSGRVCNGLELAVGFKWTDSQPISTIFEGFHDFSDFAIVSDGLTLFPEGSWILREGPEGPGTLWKCLIVV